MSKSKTINESLNKAFAELSIARHQTKQGTQISKAEYKKVNECLFLLGMLRFQFLEAHESAGN